MQSIPSPAAPSAAPPSPLLASRIRRMLQRAEAYAAAGHPREAISHLEAALAVHPDLLEALLSLAELQLKTDAYNAARETAFRALGVTMDSPRSALRLIHLLAKLSESGVILEMTRQAPPRVWDSAQSLAEIAHELTLFGGHARAREFALAALERDPAHPPSLFILATIEVFHGNLEAAADYARRCLEFLPADAGTHWLLSRLRLPDPAGRIARLRALPTSGMAPDARAQVAYALHNELHDAGEHDAAWEALEDACRTKRATLKYRPADAERAFDALCEWGGDEITAGDGHADERVTPVFVIGLHRSGTTLAERILGNHSCITAAGETYDVRAALRRATGSYLADEFDLRAVEARHRLDYRELGRGYLRGMAWRAGDSPVFTDKLPTNYMNLGFIARALPGARFIHLVRDPMDVGLSSLRTLFSHAAPYSYDQLEFVQFWRGYRRLMDHWRALVPGRILDVRYDDLVEDPVATAARMAAFCGLAPEAGMADIRGNQAAVSTASSVMMRDGIRRDRGGLWRRYERHLAPMREALGADAG